MAARGRSRGPDPGARKPGAYCGAVSAATRIEKSKASRIREALLLSISLFCSHSFCRTARSYRCSRCRSSRPFSWRGARRATRSQRTRPRWPAGDSRSAASHQPRDRIRGKRHDPRDRALQNHDADRLEPGIQLAADGGDGGHTRRIQQREHEKADGGARGEQRRNGRAAEQHLQRADDGLLGDKAGDERRGAPPVAKAERPEDGRDELPDEREQAVGTVGHDVQARVKALEEPNDDGRKENDRERALEEILCLLPEQQRHALESGHAVIRQLHDKRHGLAAEGRLVHDERREDADEDAEDIQAQHDERAVAREKRRGEKGVDRDLRRTAHIRREQDGHLPVAVGRDGARGHDGRHRAAEADEHRHDAAP